MMRTFGSLTIFGLAAAFLHVPACASSEPSPEARSVNFYNHNAQSFYDGKHYRRALLQFEKALHLDAGDHTALLGRAWCLLNLAEGAILRREKEGGRQIQLARAAFEDLEERDFGGNQYKVTLGLAKVHVLLGDLYGLRVDKLTMEAGRRPPDSPMQKEILKAVTDRDREYAAAEKLFHEVLSMKDLPVARDNLTALIELARLAVLRRDYAGALLFAERYLRQVEKSKKLWVDSIRRFPRDTALWEARLAGAVAKETEVRDLIANALFKLGRLPQAEEELGRVILLDPDRGDAYLNRAIVREELGRKKDALDDYRYFMKRAAAVELKADDPRVIKATRGIMRLEKALGLKPTIVVPAGSGGGGGSG